MKKLLKIAIVIFFCTVAFGIKASAQSMDKDAMKNSTPEQRADMQTKMMKDELALNNEQYTKVSAINLKYAKLNQTLLTDGGSRFAKARTLKKNMTEKDKELKAALTAEQYKKYREEVQEMMDNLKEAYKAKKG